MFRISQPLVLRKRKGKQVIVKGQAEDMQQPSTVEEFSTQQSSKIWWTGYFSHTYDLKSTT